LCPASSRSSLCSAVFDVMRRRRGGPGHGRLGVQERPGCRTEAYEHLQGRTPTGTAPPHIMWP
jgi:hypothetical protein